VEIIDYLGQLNIKILGQKKLFWHSLWILELFFLIRQTPGFFSRTWVRILKLVQIWHSMRRIIPLQYIYIYIYIYIYLCVCVCEWNQTFNMNVSLRFNMFKWGGLVNIKWDYPFGYPNHALTLVHFLVDNRQ
jgi:hypothetical protein